jgi:UDP-N-acetylmuramate: L-alanyl-gamma-D-glutamyl-meso-diaminopimelate ligase
MPGRIHILGIAGTFMGGVAALARELGYEVEGSDQAIYPPMSTQLEQLGIDLKQGYLAEHLEPPPGQVIVGNALSRGNPAVEHLLDAEIPYTSGAEWVGAHVLRRRTVIAVAGTHGKTTTTSLVAWLLEAEGRKPGFLVGGVPENFGISARHGAGREFVIEADEYDTAFFDKRSKFVHYRPTVAILNNLEYDHADIFPDVASIQRQFHHLVRTVPGRGRLIVNGEDSRLAEVLAMGCWTPVETFAIADRLDSGDADWRAVLLAADGSRFDVLHRGQRVGTAEWPLLGRHSVMNALAAIAAVNAVGVDPKIAIGALSSFASAKRRMEVISETNGIAVYDDFAHHPTAIATTLAGLRAKVGKARILVGMEPRSNSMRLGAHAAELAPAFGDADRVVFLKRPELPWDASKVTESLAGRGETAESVDALLTRLRALAQPGDHVVFMSNGGFEDAPRRFAALIASP